VDQSQTAIEVTAIADGAETKLIRAKEIRSLARSADVSVKSPSDKQDLHDLRDSHDDKGARVEDVFESGDRFSQDQVSSNQASDENHQPPQDHQDADGEVTPDPVAEELPEIPKEPEYNAWEVWTYLERQRLKTLKLLSTFRAEWEANRFVREAERSAPSNLRVHYEIRPVYLDESEINDSNENTHVPHPNPEEVNPDAENYADVIDVEVIK
jgi:hypothetical protein